MDTLQGNLKVVLISTFVLSHFTRVQVRESSSLLSWHFNEDM